METISTFKPSFIIEPKEPPTGADILEFADPAEWVAGNRWTRPAQRPLKEPHLKSDRLARTPAVHHRRNTAVSAQHRISSAVDNGPRDSKLLLSETTTTGGAEGSLRHNWVIG